MSKQTKGDEDLLSTLRSRLKGAIDFYDRSRQDQMQDLKFAAGTPDNKWQWPTEVVTSRAGVTGGSDARPTLTMNLLPQHIKQVTNEQRQNRPSGKVIPVDDKATVEVAELLSGMIRHIEYISDADVAIDTACEAQVTHGEGYIRLTTEYCNEDSFDQEVKILRVRNPFSVYLDPSCEDACGADAEWAIVTTTVSKQEHDQKWPNAKATADKDAWSLTGVGDNELTYWSNNESVRIVEYFYVEHENRTLNQYPDGVTSFANTPEDNKNIKLYGKPIRSRQSSQRFVRWVKSNGVDILERSDWPGYYIPVIRVIGNEFLVDQDWFVSGIVRNAKDAQRMFNYWTSQEAEMLALAPKAPFIGYAGQFEGYETQWRTANVSNRPYLEVNADATDGAGNPLPLPMRASPPAPQSGILQAKMGAADDIKSTTGQYNAALGMTSNERSGKAILARQKEADTGTYHYVDNLARAIRYMTRQIVDLIPKVYDTDRVVRIIDPSGEIGMAKIDPSTDQALSEVQDDQGVVLERIFNPQIGRYDVHVTTGPGYASKRQEALDAMRELVQTSPNLWTVIGDLLVKNMDWPGAQEMADRLSRVVDPKIKGDKNADPELQAAQQQIEAMGQELTQLHQMLKNVSSSLEAREQERKEVETTIKAFQAETQRMQALADQLTPDQISDIVAGTIASMQHSGDLLSSVVSGMNDDEIEPSVSDVDMIQSPEPPDASGVPQLPSEGWSVPQE